MSRPRGNTEERLIRAGQKLLPKEGLKGLSLRRVAKEAGVNLGMLHYHFKTKAAFQRAVLQGLYEVFFRQLTLEASKEGPPEKRLKAALGILGRFARDHREFFLMLLGEALQGQALACDFAKENIPRHLGLIRELAGDCQRKGSLRNLPMPQVLSFLVGSVALPMAVMGLIEKTKAKKPFGISPAQAAELLISDKALELRVELAFRGLAPEGKT